MKFSRIVRNYTKIIDYFIGFFAVIHIINQYQSQHKYECFLASDMLSTFRTDLYDMMMMQNAQMHSAMMQQMMLASMPKPPPPPLPQKPALSLDLEDLASVSCCIYRFSSMISWVLNISSP